MSNAEYVRQVLLSCPYITAGPFDMAIDFLDQYPTRYSIDAEPAAQVVKRYLSGDTVRRFAFALSARYETITDADRAGNAKHYEDLALWLEQQTKRRQLPAMTDGATPQAMAATGGMYLDERAEDGSSAVYRMQITLTYYQKAG